MNLTDPCASLADHSSFIGYLLGVAGLSRVVHTLAEGGAGHPAAAGADDFVYVLLGIASIGSAIDALAGRESP